MRKHLLYAVPILALGILIWGCSQSELDPGDHGNLPTATTSDMIQEGGNDGGHHDHMGGHHGDGHHGDMGACDPDSCTCADHQDCGGMMGGMDCDPECPGCGEGCGGMGDGHSHGSKHHTDHGGHEGHGDHGHHNN